VSGYFFPKGSNVMASISAIHHDPDIWTNPEDFDPFRFLDENGNFKPNSSKLSIHRSDFIKVFHA